MDLSAQPLSLTMFAFYQLKWIALCVDGKTGRILNTISPVSSASAPQPVAQTTAQPAAPPASSQAKPQGRMRHDAGSDRESCSDRQRSRCPGTIEARRMAKEAAARASEK